MSHYDPLHYLPRARVIDLPARYAVYEPSRPSENLYVVLGGRVRVFCTASDGSQTLLRVVPPEGLFGETCLAPTQYSLRESAWSLEPVQLMSWNAEQVRDRIEREPRLGLALLEYFCLNNTLMCERLFAIATYKTGHRVALGLLQLSKTLGRDTPTGAVRLIGLTHQAIADYVGTSREIVTCEMNRLRRLGYLEYSRRFTDLYADALKEAIRQEGIVREHETAGKMAAV
jgi:CRP/FNR family transcriptional regulator, cyclic AMP receptor protein